MKLSNSTLAHIENALRARIAESEAFLPVFAGKAGEDSLKDIIASLKRALTEFLQAYPTK